MHINKFFQSRIIMLYEHVSVTFVTIISVAYKKYKVSVHIILQNV